MKITFDAHVDFNATYTLEDMGKKVNVTVVDGIVTFEVVPMANNECALKEENIKSENAEVFTTDPYNTKCEPVVEEENLSESNDEGLWDESEEELDARDLDDEELDDLLSNLRDFSDDDTEVELFVEDSDEDDEEDEELDPADEFAERIAKIDKDGYLVETLTNLINTSGDSEILKSMIKEISGILNRFEDISAE